MTPTYEERGGSFLIDFLIRFALLKNDAELSKKLGIAPPVISKIRNNKLPVRSTLILRIHDVFKIDIAAIKDAAGLPKYVRRELIKGEV